MAPAERRKPAVSFWLNPGRAPADRPNATRLLHRALVSRRRGAGAGWVTVTRNDNQSVQKVEKCLSATAGACAKTLLPEMQMPLGPPASVVVKAPVPISRAAGMFAMQRNSLLPGHTGPGRMDCPEIPSDRFQLVHPQHSARLCRARGSNQPRQRCPQPFGLGCPCREILARLFHGLGLGALRKARAVQPSGKRSCFLPGLFGCL